MCCISQSKRKKYPLPSPQPQTLNPISSCLTSAYLHPIPAGEGDSCPQGISLLGSEELEHQKILNPALSYIWKIGYAVIILRMSPEVKEVVGLEGS